MFQVAFLYWVLAAGHACVARGELPDPGCTPGEVGTTDHDVVCHQGTRARRPEIPESTRRAIFASYGVPWERRHDYELDHLVPIELGGATTVLNLWPEPLDEARHKDQQENEAHRLVCAGKLDLQGAQAAFAQDWHRAIP